MKSLGILISWMTLALILVLPKSAIAATISIEQELTVYSRVAAAHTVIVDENDIVLEIISNTPGAAEIKVYRKHISKENIIPLNDKIYTRYKEIIPDGKAKAGLVYKFYQFPVLSYDKEISPVSTSLLALL